MTARIDRATRGMFAGRHGATPLDRAIGAELELRGVVGPNRTLEHARGKWQRTYAQHVRNPAVIDELLVVADAWEEADRPKEAARLRLEARWNACDRTPVSVSVPHGIFAQITMREARARHAKGRSPEHDFFRISDAAERRFGRRFRHVGPYAGPNGVFFASSYPTMRPIVWKITEDWRIIPQDSFHASFTAASGAARRLARRT